MRIVTIIITLFLLTISSVHASGAFLLDGPDQVLIGSSQSYTIKDRETLIELARIYNLGYNEITDANRGTDPWVAAKGTEIMIPGQWLLPDAPDNGIVINLAEMRLYFFFTAGKSRFVKTYPIGIGREGWRTPTGEFKVTAKVKDPTWNVPSSIREEDPELPARIAPGPDNPLGGYWIQLSAKGYGIHGTNKPYGVGRMVSHGCMRLYPEDIKVLFDLVKPGTTVKIINEPVKVGLHKDRVYIEVHCPLLELSELMSVATRSLSRKGLLYKVDTRLLVQEVISAKGLPADISK